jgi:hypothetical protein
LIEKTMIGTSVVTLMMIHRIVVHGWLSSELLSSDIVATVDAVEEIAAIHGNEL